MTPKEIAANAIVHWDKKYPRVSKEHLILIDEPTQGIEDLISYITKHPKGTYELVIVDQPDHETLNHVSDFDVFYAEIDKENCYWITPKSNTSGQALLLGTL